MKKEITMTLLDGTVVREGDKVRAQGECPGWRVCTVIVILHGGGVEKAIVTAKGGKHCFGTVIRSRYQIKPYKKGK
jgi:hypothetical protein